MSNRQRVVVALLVVLVAPAIFALKRDQDEAGTEPLFKSPWLYSWKTRTWLWGPDGVGKSIFWPKVFLNVAESAPKSTNVRTKSTNVRTFGATNQRICEE